MKCVMCRTGEVRAAPVKAEVEVGDDRLIVEVEAEACDSCGEQYYSAETVRRLERLRDDFAQKTISPAPIGRVYRVS